MWRKTAEDVFCCPACRRALRIDSNETEDWVESGALVCEACDARYPIRQGIARFVGSENYAANFGMQWNLYPTTQLDSHSGVPISRRRFDNYTGFGPRDLNGRLTLDVGCGTGRFAEIAHDYGANLVALDYSHAVEACRANLGVRPRLDYVQADINRPPFRTETFERIYCLGVIQHTPSPDLTFRSLAALVKPGGRLAIDVYPRLLRNLLFAKYWIRPLTRRISPKTSYRLVQTVFKALYPVSVMVSRIPKLGHYLKYLLPVANYHDTYPLTEAQHREWALLDTFDMWAPAFDQPQSLATVDNWFRAALFENVEVFRAGFYVGRGTRPDRPAPQPRSVTERGAKALLEPEEFH